MGKIKFISLLITWKCNSRCTTCSIWSKKATKELSLKQIDKIFRDPMLGGLTEVVVSGGEPFLRTDLVEIIKLIYQNTKASIGITTNGLLVERVVNYTKKILNEQIPVSIYISLDGPDAETYEKTRRIIGGFGKTVETIDSLSSLIQKEIFELDVGLTISKNNINKVEQTKTLINRINPNIGFGVRLSENAEYFNNSGHYFKLNQKEKLQTIDQLEKLKDGNIDFYYENIKQYLKNSVYPDFNCTAGKTSFYITPEGKLTICAKYLQEFEIGDLKVNSITEILTSNQVINNLLKTCHGCLDPCQRSWGNNQMAI